MITDSLIAKSLIYSGKCQFNRNSDIIADSGRSRAGTAAETVNGDNVCTTSGDTACDCGNIVYCSDFDNDRFLTKCNAKLEG